MKQFDQMDRCRDETQVPVIKQGEKKTFYMKYTQSEKAFIEVNSKFLTSSETLK